MVWRSPYSPAVAMRRSLIELLVAITKHVRIDDDMFDEIVGMLLPVIHTNATAREALEGFNPDAVWLALWRLKITSVTESQDHDATGLVYGLRTVANLGAIRRSV